MAERFAVTVKELVQYAPLLMLIAPMGRVISVAIADVLTSAVVSDSSFPYVVPVSFFATSL